MGQFWQTTKGYLLTTGLRLVEAVVIVIVGFIVVDKLKKLIHKGRAFSKLDANAQSIIEGFVSISLKIVLVLTAAAVLGIPMTNMVAILGSCGLAIGLSLQGSLSNLAGGLMMLIFKPFKIGDYISTQVGEGTVAKITVLYTYIITTDHLSIVIPNGTLSNSPTTNYTAEEIRRADLSVAVSYKSDLQHVRKVLLKLAGENQHVLGYPKPDMIVVEYGESSIKLVLRVWIKTQEYFEVSTQVRENIKTYFDANGIEIPFPQVDIHVNK